MSGQDDPEDLEADAEAVEVRIVAVGPADAGGRIDKVLAGLAPELSRARLQALIAQGRVSHGGTPITDASSKAQPGDYRIEIPAPVAAEPAPGDRADGVVRRRPSDRHRQAGGDGCSSGAW
ncbi:S4 domain-containing protein, partial [Phenylobacterium sp.]|uniref:S4 domain-containing protein n=1 Tax=Phenylobacterium sp. TaxID=1871053 RepID=UPI00286AC44F